MNVMTANDQDIFFYKCYVFGLYILSSLLQANGVFLLMFVSAHIQSLCICSIIHHAFCISPVNVNLPEQSHYIGIPLWSDIYNHIVGEEVIASFDLHVCGAYVSVSDCLIQYTGFYHVPSRQVPKTISPKNAIFE